MDLTDLIVNQPEINFDIVWSIWYFEDKVSCNPQNFVWVVLVILWLL
jgi:hypothetical protein